MIRLSTATRLAVAALAATLAVCAAPATPGEGDAPAAEELSSRLLLAPESEPGDRLTVEGILRDADGSPLPGTRVRAFHTDAEGYYARGPEGRELGSDRARLSGWLVTDEEGRFRIDTILPGGYPSGRSPSHMHFDVLPPGYEERELSLFFEDDPRLTPAERRSLEPYPENQFQSLERAGEGRWRCRLELRMPPS